jgi:hypothetical protein
MRFSLRENLLFEIDFEKNELFYYFGKYFSTKLAMSVLYTSYVIILTIEKLKEDLG